MAMTSDSGRGMTIEERDAFLTSGAIFSKIATTMADGWPVMSPVWYDLLAGEQVFLVVSKERTSMVRNLRRDPRCGLLIDNLTTPYKRVSVQGEVEFLPGDSHRSEVWPSVTSVYPGSPMRRQLSNFPVCRSMSG